MRIVVLSCGDLGIEVANALVADDTVDVVGLVTAPYRTPRRSFIGKLRHIRRMQGWRGFASVAAAKVAAVAARGKAGETPHAAQSLTHLVPHFHFAEFHDSEARTALHDLRPDLGVIAGTYILKESVFGIPRLGSINLHSGKVPTYRGAAPAFWEVYNGERSVGITIHRVAAEVDAGHVLAQEEFPIDPAPGGNPVQYIDAYRRDVLRPNGVRMVVSTVRALAAGTATERPQNPTHARQYKSPDYRAIRELRRRILERRGDRP